MTGTGWRARVWGLLGSFTVLGARNPRFCGRLANVALPVRPSGPVRRAGNGPSATGSSGSGNQRSAATRIAIDRVTRRSRHTKTGGVLGLVILMLFITVIVVTGTAVLTAVSAGSALMASLEQGLPDVHTFDHLQFAQPTKVYDRTGEHQLAIFRSEQRQVVKYSQLPQLVLDVTTAVEDRHVLAEPGL